MTQQTKANDPKMRSWPLQTQQQTTVTSSGQRMSQRIRKWTLTKNWLLLSICLLLCVVSKPEVEALKLPSLFSWMQQSQTSSLTPSNAASATQQKQQQQQISNAAALSTSQQQQILPSISSHQLLGSLAGKTSGASGSEEPMLASATSIFDSGRAALGAGSQQQSTSSAGSGGSATQQVGSALRKPFQSILMLPSKHNQMHLFSSLPKSLFGRFLSSSTSPTSSSSSSSTGSSSSQQSSILPSLNSWSTAAAAAATGNHLRAFPTANHQITISAADSEQRPQQQFLQSLNNNNNNKQNFNPQHTFQPHLLPAHHHQHHQHHHHHHHHHQLNPHQQQTLQQQRPAAHLTGSDFPKEHALGFGDNGDFVIMDPNQENLTHLNMDSNPTQFQEQSVRETIQDPSVIDGSTLTLMSEHSESNATSGLEHDEMMKPANLSNIELTASESYSNSSNMENSIKVHQIKLNETVPMMLNESMEQKDSSVVQPPVQQTGSQQQQQQQWDSETSNNSTTPSASSQSIAATIIGGEAQQLNSTTGDYLQALFANNKQTTGEEDSMTSSSSSSNKTTPDNDQAAILFLDSQSFQQLQEQSALNRQQQQQQVTNETLIKDEKQNSSFGSKPQTVNEQQPTGTINESESSTAAIIVAPGDSETAQSISEQLANDEQLESFILGPYKGLTSDSMHHLTQPSAEQNQFRSLASAASSIQQHHMQQQQQQHQPLVTLPNKASSLLNQAKSLIHFPFVHMASVSATGQGNAFGGHQKQAQSSGGQSRSRDLMLKEPTMSFVTNSAPNEIPILPMHLRHPSDGQGNSKQNNNYQSMGFYGNKVTVQQQQQQPSTQSVWPQASSVAAAAAANGGRSVGLKQPQSNNNRLTNQVASGGSHTAPLAATNLQPIHAQPFKQQHANYFLMQPTNLHRVKQAKQLFHSNQQHTLPQMSATNQQARFHHQQQQQLQLANVEVAGGKSNVPYFVDSQLQQQQQPMNREPQQQQQVQVQVHHTRPPMSDNNFRFSQTGPVFEAKQSLNNMNNRQQQQFQFVVDHANSQAIRNPQQQQQQQQQGYFQESGEQLGRQPMASGKQQHFQLPQQQQQLLQNQAAAAAKKFKSGLYQIDPPKLVDGSSTRASEQQQQHQLVQVPENALTQESDEASELQQQQQRMRPTGADDQQRKVNSDTGSDDSDDSTDDDDQLSQQATESPEVDSQPPTGFSTNKLVGATIGVGLGAHNRSMRGQVFDEPVSGSGGEQTRLNELRSLKLTQDITLYDFEYPQQKQQQQDDNSFKSNARQQQPQQKVAASHQVNQASLAPTNSIEQQKLMANSQPISFLDTQVYTVPYTITAPPGGGQPTQQQRHQNNFHQFHTIQHNQPMRLSPSAPRPLHQQPQQMVYQQHQQQHPATTQIGRFPLPYLAPPAPMRPQVQQNQNQQQQAFLKSIYQEMGAHQQQANAPQINWMHPPLPSVPALSIQTIDDDSLINSLQPTRQQQQQQHYFHYQPLNNQQQQFMSPRPQQQQQQQILYQQKPSIEMPSAANQRVPSEHQYELTAAPHLQQTAATAQAPNQHQFVLAIQHQPDQSATSAVSQQQQQVVPSVNQLKSSEFGSAQVESTTAISPIASVDGSNSFTSPSAPTNSDQAANQNSNLPPTEASAQSSMTNSNQQESDSSDDSSEDDESPSLSSNSNNRKRPTGTEQQTQNVQQQQQQQEQTQQAPQLTETGVLPSSPSAFCADRAPGLYADESQRCKAYYQCAPTGHQMFKCNNQTQFNQKTQNCDWWYNVNCGGRQGSQSDFEQAPVLVTMPTNEQAAAAAAGKQRQSQDREAAASSHEISGAMRADPQQQQQQAASGEEQANQNSDLATLRQQARQKLNRWQTNLSTRQQQQQQQFNRPEDEQTGSNSLSQQQLQDSSLTNTSTETPFQSQQLSEQQASPTSATPVYVSPNIQLIEQQQQQQQQTSTTQDSQTAQSTELIPTESPSGSGGSLPEPKPQVGANLSEEQIQQQQQSISNSNLQNQQQSTSEEQQTTTQPTSSQTSTISDNNNNNNSRQTSTQSSGAVSPNSSSSVEQQQQTEAPQTPNEQQPESRLGQQQLRLFQQQQEIVADSLADSLEQEPEVRENQNSAGESKRLVQSEFGLGVQQQQQQYNRESNSKSARSAIRFEFTRNGVAVRPPNNQHYSTSEQLLMSGNLLNGDNDDQPIMDSHLQQQQQHHHHHQPQYSNHKYSFGDQAIASQQHQLLAEVGNSGSINNQFIGEQPSIYSTSANQGSVNYVPLDEHSFLTAKAVQEAAAAAIAQQSADSSPQQAQQISSSSSSSASSSNALPETPTDTTTTTTTPSPSPSSSTTTQTTTTTTSGPASSSPTETNNNSTTTTTTKLTTKKLDRRFGARLLSPTSGSSARSSGGNELNNNRINRSQKRRSLPVPKFIETIAPVTSGS